MPTETVRGLGDYPAERDLDDAEREFEEAGEVQKSIDYAGTPEPAGTDDIERAERAEQGGRRGQGRGEGASVDDIGLTTIAQPPRGN